jgi:hypothetical protein
MCRPDIRYIRYYQIEIILIPKPTVRVVNGQIAVLLEGIKYDMSDF